MFKSVSPYVLDPLHMKDFSPNKNKRGAEMIIDPPSSKRMKEEEEEIIETTSEIVDPNDPNLVKGRRTAIVTLYGPPGAGKSQAMARILFDKLADKSIDEVLVIDPNEWNGTWSFLPRKAVKPMWTEALAKKILARQSRKDRKHLAIVLEDQLGVFNWNSPATIQLFTRKRHYNVSLYISAQYAPLVPTYVREIADNIGIFKQRIQHARESMWKAFGGLFPSEEAFYKALEDNTKDHNFMWLDSKAETWDRIKVVPVKPGIKFEF